MDIIFSTSDVDPRRRFDHWHSVFCEKIINHDCVPKDRSTFRAHLKHVTIGDIELIMIENSPMRVARTFRHIWAAPTDYLFLWRQFIGRLSLEQAGQSRILESGDMMVLDPELPYRGVFMENSRILALKIPRVLVEHRLGNSASIAGRPIRKSLGACAMLSTFLATLPSHAGNLSQAANQVATHYLLDLLALSIAGDPCS